MTEIVCFDSELKKSNWKSSIFYYYALDNAVSFIESYFDDIQKNYTR